MANSLTAYLARSQVPNRQALQTAIQAHKFKLTIDDAYVPFDCAGYIPCTLDGEDAGFEIKFSARLAPLDNPHLQAQLGGRDTAITLRWSGDLRERISAMMISAALAHGFDALVLRQSEEDFAAADQLLDETRAAFMQLQEH